MLYFKRLKFFVLAALATFLLTAATEAATQPDPSTNPALANILKMGAKFYYLGSSSGMDGWFLVKDGRVQIVYSTPDKQSIIIGALFDSQGNSVTATQLKALVASNKDVASLLTNAAQEEASLNNNSPPAASPAPANGLPSIALSPGEQLMQQLTTAAGVTVGSGKGHLFMVMDPNCPHCQATWRALKPSVVQGALQIRMIPIGAPNTDNERAAAVFLHATDPLTVWDKYVNGDKTQLAGSPDPALLAAVRANHQLIDSWNIPVTPYMVYRAKDGKVKIVQGELDKPEKVTLLLADLGS